MRTNIVIDDELMSKALRVSQLTTKREVVETALREFVQRRDQGWLLDLIGAAPGYEIPEDDDRYKYE